MAVIREGGTDPGSQRGRKGGTKGMQLLILLIQFMIWAWFGKIVGFVTVVHVVFVPRWWFHLSTTGKDRTL